MQVAIGAIFILSLYQGIEFLLLSVKKRNMMKLAVQVHYTDPSHSHTSKLRVSGGQKRPGEVLDKILSKQLTWLDEDAHLRSILKASYRQGIELFSLGEPLWIDRCEVSQKDFSNFIQWKQSPRDTEVPEGTSTSLATYLPPIPKDWKHYSETSQHAIFGRLEAPVNGVTFYDAQAYCTASGGALPTDKEWQAIAAGRESRLYPWGNAMEYSPWVHLDPRLNLNLGCRVPDPLDEKSATPEGVYHMGSSVSEWTLSAEWTEQRQVQASGKQVTPQQTTKKLKLGAEDFARIQGGNAYKKPYELYSLNIVSQKSPPDYRSPYLGFRCVYRKKLVANPWRSPKQLIRIPAGTYRLGTDSELLALSSLAKDTELHKLKTFQQRQTRPTSFYMSISEVTVGEYRRFLRNLFVKAKVYANKNEPRYVNYIPRDWREQKRHPKRPVRGVDWWSAYAYASWLGGRLPAENEWILATLKSQDRQDEFEGLYPWNSNIFQEHLALTREWKQNSPTDIGGHPEDQTYSGIYDMAGNVSEWTRSIRIHRSSFLVRVKGASFLLPGEHYARIHAYRDIPPSYQGSDIGFRVVFDP